ncbi:MAG: beta-ketoacyl-ACP reductase [SAR116 cluster bacterium]|nr:beta-ketoacyl-ACP reductase [SAR116 cluster bacterium]
MNEFENKVALITGASGAIGKDIAQALSKKGASVILCGTRQDTLAKIANDLNGSVSIICENLKNTEKFVKALEKTNLKVDILINNAGVTQDNLLVRMSEGDIEDVINVNLTSLIKITKFLLKNMMKQKYGRIISISSVVGFTGNPGQTNYCASKSGIIGFTKSLALEVASRGITVNAVAPGFITSPMTEKLNEIQRESVTSRIPVQRLGSPSDITNSVLFLANEKSSYITGNTIHVNGGLAMI